MGPPTIASVRRETAPLPDTRTTPWSRTNAIASSAVMLVPGAEPDGLTDRSGRGIILRSRSAVEEAREECRQRGPPFGQQLWRDIDIAAMNVAPAPGLAAFVGCNQRMTGRVEVLQSVRVLRILAASDMAAGQAYPKLGPLRPEREAFLTAARCRRYLPNLAYMFAMFGHWLHPPPRDVRVERDARGERRHRVFRRTLDSRRDARTSPYEVR